MGKDSQDDVDTRVAITGGRGFIGQWLTRELLRQGKDVWLGGRGPRPGKPPALSQSEWSATRWVTVDVRDDAQVAAFIEASRPRHLYHLAGISFVPEAEDDPAAAYDINLVGSVRVLTAAAKARRSGHCDPTVVLLGSGIQYGDHQESESPLPETAELRPPNVYAATKVAQEIAALQLGSATGMRVICTRTFPHGGAGQDPRFLIPSLVARVRGLRDGKGDLRIGNNVVRDYLHVEDAVAAYSALAERAPAGVVYNVCSGKGISVRELAELALQRGGAQGSVIEDQSLKRSADIQTLVGSPRRLAEATGWRPRKTARDIIDDVFASVTS